MSKIYYAEFVKSTTPVNINSTVPSYYCLTSSKKKISREIEITASFDSLFNNPSITRDMSLVNDDYSTFSTVKVVNIWYLRLALEALVSGACRDNAFDEMLRFLTAETELLILKMRSDIHRIPTSKPMLGSNICLIYEKL